MVLIITGKGGDTGSGERGVLRHAVPRWLSSLRFRPLVSGFHEAHRTHGGAGALYVRLKRSRG
jgi:DNA-nicking Smr family endonuclease